MLTYVFSHGEIREQRKPYQPARKRKEQTVPTGVLILLPPIIPIALPNRSAVVSSEENVT